MAASSSRTTFDLDHNEVDDSYFAALIDDDEIFPISDEKYAEELQLQEALFSSSSSLLNIPSPKNDIASSSNTKPQPLVVSFETSQSPKNFCDICMDTKTESEMFRNTNACSHLFCFDCIRGHVASKIKQNITTVTCPNPECNEVIGPEACKTIVPQEVLERWENALCESLIMGSEKFYCPFKDCSAMLVDDGGEYVTSSECPHCNRLFCAQCKVTWHSGMDCSEFQSLKEGERDPNDIMLMDLAKNKKWRRCPSCKFYVERTDGCLHITCRCGYHFCYGCGEKHTSSHACALTIA
ncbi:zinc finger, C6HC-type containing protein [Tanacetum coccineum]